MNNSSDSENDNINKIKIDSQKKRGRPKKNLYLEKNTKSSDKKQITNEEKDIILHLPVFLPKNNKNVENNKFTTTTNYDNKNNDTALSLSEDEESSVDTSDDFCDSESEYDKYKKLYAFEQEENRKKDLLIKKLREDSSKKTSSIFDSEVQKDLKVHIIDMKFVDSVTNKLFENKKTDVHCWWCTYQFDTNPCCIPEKFYNDKYYVFGCFCSFNCASSYNLNMNDYKVMERYALLKKIYIQTADKKSKLAPPKEVLKKYGGVVEIEDYRRNFTMCDKEFRMTLPPLMAIHNIIEEITIEKHENKDNTIKTNINGIKKKLPIVKNNLFNTMGIKNK
jgi:hypothetical protein